ncbi:MAG: hypothetical protein J0L70_29975 [Leptolyngbya sp. UWPOB_LEPTO1]|uniref:hypothetical protein n=1 Tax=Leptolyngbya sp. UWPOB_LEPTO1 TaxID=2815653 RepID=UPI001ACCF504|nr:hypothetical protein [Leptolyngbya sp. UWPOB_LEPTO1]MBN8564765.1 hypothetical protein [Leptolyngbya sp. UWPOB_LEPTO1]
MTLNCSRVGGDLPLALRRASYLLRLAQAHLPSAFASAKNLPIESRSTSNHDRSELQHFRPSESSDL